MHKMICCDEQSYNVYNNEKLEVINLSVEDEKEQVNWYVPTNIVSKSYH